MPENSDFNSDEHYGTTNVVGFPQTYAPGPCVEFGENLAPQGRNSMSHWYIDPYWLDEFISYHMRNNERFRPFFRRLLLLLGFTA